MRAIRLQATGDPSQLRLAELPEPAPGPGYLRIRVAAIGVNFIDTYHRSGLYPVSLPYIPGGEAAGVVSAVGEGVTGFSIGDRVVSARVEGAYAESALAPAEYAVPVPADVELAQAAALLLQGLTAHVLACSVFPLKAGDTVLVHAAAGGVGQLLVQLARRRGARVLATVGSAAKVAVARAAGADSVCDYTQEDFATAARAFTGGWGVDVVYDGVGRVTFEGSLNSLRRCGMMVSYGNASGPVPPVSPLVLMQKGSLFLTRPMMFHYTADAAELRARCADLFAWVRTGELKVSIGATFPLAEAAAAHRALEGRRTTGKVLLVP